MTQLKEGDLAPDFTAETDGGQTTSLQDYKGKTVVLYFYPKDDTPGCTKQACGFRDHNEDFSGKNVVVLGVSPDDSESHRKFKAKYNLPFDLLVDSEHEIADAYGVWGEKSMYGRKYMGIIRSHFVIDPTGKLSAVHYKISPLDSIKNAVKVANRLGQLGHS